MKQVLGGPFIPSGFLVEQTSDDFAVTGAPAPNPDFSRECHPFGILIFHSRYKDKMRVPIRTPMRDRLNSVRPPVSLCRSHQWGPRTASQ
jgi:hypothetical protein